MPPPDLFVAFAEAFPLTGSVVRAYLRQRYKDCRLDVTTEMMQVMHYLWRHNGVNQQEIANAVNRDKASLTARLDNLVRRELVERQADYLDRRSKLIMLTAKGRALEQQVMLLVQQMYEVASRGLSEDGLRTSLAVLAQITQNLTLAKS